MLRTILNKSWKLHPTKQQLYGHLPPISKTIQVNCSRNAGLVSDVLQWIPSHSRSSVGRPRRTYLQQLRTDKGCSLEDPSGAMDDRDEWRERLREIRASCLTSWWWRPCGSNKGFSSRFCVGSRIQHETPEEDRSIYRPTCYEYNNED